jgi:hypothetical protein
MSSEYPGFPTVVKLYWRHLTQAFAGVALAFVFMGSFTALLLSTTFSKALPFFWAAAASLIIHSTALGVKDVWTGQYDPNQTEFASWMQLVALYVISGIFISSLLLIASVGAALMPTALGAPPSLAWVFATYYPVADMVAMRNKIWTPGYTILLGTALLIGIVFDIHQSLLDSLPILGDRHRPQS